MSRITSLGAVRSWSSSTARHHRGYCSVANGVNHPRATIENLPNSRVSIGNLFNSRVGCGHFSSRSFGGSRSAESTQLLRLLANNNTCRDDPGSTSRGPPFSRDRRWYSSSTKVVNSRFSREPPPASRNTANRRLYSSIQSCTAGSSYYSKATNKRFYSDKAGRATNMNASGKVLSDTTPAPAYADVVVIGGGSLGCNALYHLARKGVYNTVLIEANKLTSGTENNEQGN